MGLAVSASEVGRLRKFCELAPKYKCNLKERDTVAICQWARRQGHFKELKHGFWQQTWKDTGADLWGSVQNEQPEACKRAPIHRTLNNIMIGLHGEVEAKKALQEALGIDRGKEEASFASPMAPPDPADVPLPTDKDPPDRIYPDLTRWKRNKKKEERVRTQELLERWDEQRERRKEGCPKGPGGWRQVPRPEAFDRGTLPLPGFSPA